MKALLWKDVRVNRSVLLFAVVLLLAPYIIGLIGGLYAKWQGGLSWWEHNAVMIMAHLSLLLSMITVAMIAGNAFAAERADRSAEFLAFLPPSRLSLITSKIILAVGVSVLVLLCNLLVIRFLAPHLPGAPQQAAPEEIDVSFMVTALLMFGVAWLCSSFASSPAMATSGGFISPMLLGAVIYAAGHLLRPLSFETLVTWFNNLGIAGGIFGFIAGSVYYLRRFEP